jgi:hypothetical protein
MIGIKSLKSLFTLTWGIARSPRSRYFFVTGNHNKSENEILSIRNTIIIRQRIMTLLFYLNLYEKFKNKKYKL